MDLLAQYDSDDSDNSDNDDSNQEIEEPMISEHNFKFKRHDNTKDISLDLNNSNTSNLSLFDSLPIPSSILSSSTSSLHHDENPKKTKKHKKKRKGKKKKKKKKQSQKEDDSNIMNETKIENDTKNDRKRKHESISLIDILPEPKHKKRKIEAITDSISAKVISTKMESSPKPSSINKIKTNKKENNDYDNDIDNNIINVSQRDDLLKRDANEIRRTFEIDDIVREEIKVVPTNTYNAETGKIESVSKYTKTQRKKHQINTLAYEAQEKALQLAMRRSASYKTKAETQAKYGW